MGASRGVTDRRLIRRGSRSLRAGILKDAAKILVEYPSDDLNMQAMVRLTGASLWALRYHFGTFAALFRAAAIHVIEDAEAALPSFRAPQETVVEGLQSFAGALRETMSAEPYRNMLYLVIRHGKSHHWLREAYERRIVAKVSSDLSDLVLGISERHGAPVLFREGVTHRFHRRIETEFALRSLLSPLEAASSEEAEAVLSRIVRETFLGSYCFDWQGSNAA